MALDVSKMCKYMYVCKGVWYVYNSQVPYLVSLSVE